MSRPLIPGAGRIINKDNVIHFDHVPLVTPNGDVLVEDMSFEVHSGMNVLVCGPNGCGKSSLFRILGEVSLLASPTSCSTQIYIRFPALARVRGHRHETSAGQAVLYSPATVHDTRLTA